ncbi:MAG: autotransporter domain-containing protein [Akkermansia sp.]
MKLHLPFRLRASLLAAIAMLGGIVPTLSTGSLAVGVCAYTLSVSTAQGKSLTLGESVTISAWEVGAELPASEADRIFANGDTVTVDDGAMVTAVLTGAVETKLAVLAGSSLTLSSNGGSFAADSTIRVNGWLTLNDATVLGDATFTKASTEGWVVVNWGLGVNQSLATALEKYVGNLEIRQSAYTLTAAESGAGSGSTATNKYDTVYLHGGNTVADKTLLTMAAGVYHEHFQFGGEVEVNVATDIAWMQGGLSGSGHLVKSGAGTLALAYLDALHNGTLTIQEGTLAWGNPANTGSEQWQVNLVGFKTIEIENGATMSVGHWGVNMSDQTDVYSTGGTIRCFDTRRVPGNIPADPVEQSITETYLRSLHVNGTAPTSLGSTNDWKYALRFGVLTSDDAAPDGSRAQLALSAPREDGYVLFDTIRNYHGFIGGMVATDTKQLLIHEVDQAAGYVLNMSGTDAGTDTLVRAYDASKKGEGTLNIRGELQVRNTLEMQAGMLSVSGALSAANKTLLSGGQTNAATLTTKSLSVSGETTQLAITGASDVTHETRVAAGTVQLDSLQSGSLTMAGGSLTVTNTLRVIDSIMVENAGAALTVEGQADVLGDVTLQAGSATLSDAVNINGTLSTVGGTLSCTGADKVVSVAGLRIGAGALTVAGTLRVNNMLTMNYANTAMLNIGTLALADNIVLSYNNGSALLDLSAVDTRGISRINLDLSEVDFDKLRNGLNTGIEYALVNQIHIAALSSNQYVLSNDNGLVKLTVKEDVTGLNKVWDANWGADTVARSVGMLETRPLGNNTPLGLYDNDLYDKNGVISAKLAASASSVDAVRECNVFGGGYHARRADADGLDLEREVWLELAEGAFNMVGGGNYATPYREYATTGHFWLTGDTHLMLDADASVSSIAGGNVFARNNSEHLGSSYLSISSSQVGDSVVGGSVFAGDNNTYVTQKGDTHLFLYQALSMDASKTEENRTVVHDWVSGDVIGGTGYVLGSNVIAAGHLNFIDGTSTVNGNTSLVFEGFNAGVTNKVVAGGNYSYQITHTDSLATDDAAEQGNSSVIFRGLQNDSFSYILSAGHGAVGSPNAVTQQQAGDTLVQAENSSALTFNGVVGGHQNVLTNRDHGAQNQLQEGSAVVDLRTNVVLNPAQADTRFWEDPLSASLVGGHFYVDYQDDPPPAYQLTQDRKGSTEIRVGCAEAASQAGATIVGGHYVFSRENDIDIIQKQEDSILVDVTNLAATTESYGVVGGHVLVGIKHTLSQTIDGSVTVNLTDVSVQSGGGYSVIGGCAGVGGESTSTIKGDVNLNILRGSYANTIVGGTYNSGTAYIHDINIRVDSATLGGTFVGAYDSCSGSVNDVNILMTGNTVSTGTIYGGSINAGGGRRLRQNNITLTLEAGSYSGDIYLAGMGNRTTDVGAGVTTNSTTLEIHQAAHISSGIISGGYSEWGTNIVSGNRTVRFVEAGRYDLSGSTFYDFNYFDVVNAGGEVLLQSSLQLAEAATVNKVGEGTLSIVKGAVNSIRELDVKEGTLVLAADTRRDNNIENTFVRDGAILDLSASNIGLNGKLMLNAGSQLTISPANTSGSARAAATQSATVTGLVWGNDNDSRVNLNIGEANAIADADGFYEVDLVTGLTRESIQGIAFDTYTGWQDDREVTYSWAADAEPFITLTDGNSVEGGILYLRATGTLDANRSPLYTLVLRASTQPARYWTAVSGSEWNTTDMNWHLRDGYPPAEANAVFENGKPVFFTKDGTATNAAVVKVGQDVTAYNMTIVGDGQGAGNYLYQLQNHTVTVSHRLNAWTGATGRFERGQVTVAEEVSLSGGSTLTFAQDASLTLGENVRLTLENGSTLEVNNDLTVKALVADDASTTKVLGKKLTLRSGSSSAGQVQAAALELGGSTSFKSLSVTGAVTGNSGYTLTVNGDSSMGSLDGGSLTVNSGVTTMGSGARLTALSGAGTVAMSGKALTLDKASSIGALTAGPVTVGETLSVSGTLTTDSITLKDLSVVPQNKPVLKAGTILSAGSGQNPVSVYIADEVISAGSYHVGVSYLVVQSGQPGSTLSLNGHGSTFDTQDGHYRYRLESTADGNVYLEKSLWNHHYFSDLAETENGLAGGKLLDEVLSQGALPGQEQADSSDLVRLIDRLDTMANDGKSIDKTMAAAAGSSIATVGLAFAEDMQRQLKSIRNRTTVMGVDGGVVNEGMPYYNAWINAEGSSHQFNSDGTYTGYSLNSFGGTVGFDVDVNPSLTCGLALTALTGDFTSDDVDKLDGNLDTQYLTAFARYVRRAWTHTLVFSVGRADVSADRTVTCEDLSYKTKYDSDGMAFGFLYELGRVFALNESHTACIQPLVNVMWTHSSISGAEETGSDAGLKVDDMTMDTLTFGAGARVQALVGEDIYNRSSILEARALLKLDVGDRQGEADVAFAALNTQTQKVKSAEAGPVGLEIGAGITIPVGPDSASVFADASLELRSGYVNGAGTVGIRVNF